MNDTDTPQLDEVSDIDAEITTLRNALVLIETALGMTAGHQVVAASEMTDILLDIRGLVAPLVR